MGAICCATAQFEHRANDKVYNLAVIERLTEDAARRSARIVAFPEMCVTGYWHVRNLDRPAIEALAEAVPDGPSVETLTRLAKRCGLAVGAGLIEQDEDGRLYNAYVVALPDRSKRTASCTPSRTSAYRAARDSRCLTRPGAFERRS